MEWPAGSPAPDGFEAAALQEDSALLSAAHQALGASFPRYGIVIKRFHDGRGMTSNPGRRFYAASLFKLPMLYELYRQRALGQVSLDERLQVSARYLEYDLETLRWPVGSFISVGELARAMITYSDNVSAIMLQDRLGGWNVNASIRMAGLLDTAIITELPTTAADIARLLELIALGQAVDYGASREMLDLLVAQQINDRLPASLPPGTVVAHKTGNWDDACHDAGIVYAPSGPYVIAVLSDLPGCSAPVAAFSRAVYDVMESPLDGGTSDRRARPGLSPR